VYIRLMYEKITDAVRKENECGAFTLPHISHHGRECLATSGGYTYMPWRTAPLIFEAVDNIYS